MKKSTNQHSSSEEVLDDAVFFKSAFSTKLAAEKSKQE